MPANNLSVCSADWDKRSKVGGTSGRLHRPRAVARHRILAKQHDDERARDLNSCFRMNAWGCSKSNAHVRRGTVYAAFTPGALVLSIALK